MEKTTLGVTEQNQEQLRVQQQQYLTANHKKEDKEFKYMDVRQKMCYLQVLQKRQGLTNDQQDMLNKLEEENSVPVTNNQNLQKEKPKDSEEPKDIFKEEDILKYMYEDWLLAGANWLFKKTYKAVDWTLQSTNHMLYKGARAGYDGLKEGFGKKSAAKDNTTEYVGGLDSVCAQANKDNIEITNNANNVYQDKINRYTQGNVSDEERKDILFQIVDHMSPNQKNAFKQNMGNMSESMTENIKLVNHMGTMMARAQLAQNSMLKEDPGLAPTKESFAARARLNTLRITRELTALQDPEYAAQRRAEGKPATPEAFMEDMYKNITEANKYVNKQLDKGNYGKKAKDIEKNKALVKMNNLLDLTPEGTPRPNVVENTQPQTLEEWSAITRQTDITQHQSLEEIRNKETYNRGDVQTYMDRIANLQRRVANMPRAPEHLRQKINEGATNDNTQLRPSDRARGGGR